MAKKRDDSGMQAKLMNAAMTAFSRKGLNHCRMSDIAEAAGLARGTAYLYFKSKEQLMLGMYKLYSSKIIQSQKTMLAEAGDSVSYTHLRAHETGRNLVCRLLLEKKK